MKALTFLILAILFCSTSDVWSASDELCDRYRLKFERGYASRWLYADLAECSATAGDLDSAFKYLDHAIKKRNFDIAYVVNSNAFEKVRQDARWSEMLAAWKLAEKVYLEQINKAVHLAKQADQQERKAKPIDWALVNVNDEARRELVRSELAANRIKHSDDYFNAALIMQHGHNQADYKLAYELSLKAVQIDPEHHQAKWLAAAAEDRWLIEQGKPQIWGTQWQSIDGKLTLLNHDLSLKTDEQRWQAGIKSVEEILAP